MMAAINGENGTKIRVSWGVKEWAIVISAAVALVGGSATALDKLSGIAEDVSKNTASINAGDSLVREMQVGRNTEMVLMLNTTLEAFRVAIATHASNPHQDAITRREFEATVKRIDQGIDEIKTLIRGGK